MKKSELKQLIAECIVETIKENPELMDEGFFKNMFGDTTNAYTKFAKQHNAGADVHDIKKSVESKITSALKDAFKMGEVAGMDKKEISKIFRSAITGIFNKYNKLEEKVQ